MKALTQSLVLLCAALAQPAWAQNYPSKTIQLVVTAGPGSSADITARIVGEELGKLLGQPVVIDNRAGAGGNIAAEYVAKAPADGHTLLMATGSTHGINPSLYGKLRFDPIADFAPIGLITTSPNVLVVSNKLGLRSVQDIVAAARKGANELSYSSGGSGTSQHLAGEVFASAMGVKLLHVPYKAAPQAMTAVISGEVSMSFVSAPVALAQSKSNAIVPIGVTSLQPLAMWPELPTIASLGLAGFDVSAWFGLAAPAGTPAPVVDKLHDSLRKVLEMSTVRARLHQQGMEVARSSPTHFAGFIKSEIERWTQVVRASGARVD